MSSSPALLQPGAAAPDKKDWKQMHKDSKELKKKFREENLIKKLEKKRRHDEAAAAEQALAADSAGVRPVSTISIAVPGSIMDNAQSAELRTYLAGQIARAACVYRIDEVIVFDDYGRNAPADARQASQQHSAHNGESDEQRQTTVHHGCLQLARILQYLECPQYLRKFFFPLHKDLKFSGLLNPLDAPHHLRQQNEFVFREGVVTAKPVRESGGSGSYVNIGLLNDCMVDKVLTPGLRVTVRLQDGEDLRSRKIKARIVSPAQPRAETGVYWGYTVRVASCLSDVFAQSPYDGGYDLTVGTSDKGRNVHEYGAAELRFEHALVVFGGVQGLEAALENDDRLSVDDPALLFDEYVNIAPGQGSRTIRTEEAILIALAGLEEKLAPVQPAREFVLSEGIPQSEDTGVKRVFEPRRPKQTRTEPLPAETNGGADETAQEAVPAKKKKKTKSADDLDRFD